MSAQGNSPANRRESNSPSEQLARDQLTLDAWKYIVGVQMHFNDMAMRVRSLGVTIILAVYGAAIVSFRYDIGFWKLHISLLIAIGGMLGWLAIMLLDGYYHKLLRAAVAESERIERENPAFRLLGMTQAISQRSRNFKLLKGRTVTARSQINLLFYGPIYLVGAIFLFVSLLFFWNPSGYSPPKRSLSEEVRVWASAGCCLARIGDSAK